MVLIQLDVPMQKINLDKDLTLFTKISSKRITDINIKHKNIKLIEDNTGKKPR